MRLMMHADSRSILLELQDLSGKLSASGWDRMRGVRLLGLLEKIKGLDGLPRGPQISGRIQSLQHVLTEFIAEPPSPGRLDSVIQIINMLFNLIEFGEIPVHFDASSLPSRPADWRFLLAGELGVDHATVQKALRVQGFVVDSVNQLDEVISGWQSGTVVVAGVNWLTRHELALNARPNPKNLDLPTSPLLVAIADTDSFRDQVRSRQMGARLIINAPMDIYSLLTELAGLAWMPRQPYRLLFVDDDSAVLKAHAFILEKAGFEVMATPDPVLALEYVSEFSPEVCLLDVEMSACRGTDLAALLRRDKAFARMPVIYISAFADMDHQLDAHLAGGEDYLVKPVNERLLISAALNRARSFRQAEIVYRQRKVAWQELAGFKQALDLHAIVSITDRDGSIIEVNPRFCEVSGYRADELLGYTHRIIKSGRHPPSFFETMWQTIASGQAWQGEIQNRRKDGSHYWVLSTIAPVLDEQGLPKRYIAVRTDISQQKQVLSEQKRQTRLLDLLRQACQTYITHTDLAQVSAHLLEGLLALTESDYGFIGEILQEEDGTPYLHTLALTDIAWNEDSRCLYDSTRASGMAFNNLDTLFGEAVRTGQPVYANQPAEDPRRGGLPPGHPPLNAFLGLPLHTENKMVGLLGLANRPEGYDTQLSQFLQPFVDTYAQLILANQHRQHQASALQAMRAEGLAKHGLAEQNDWLTAWGQSMRTPLNAILAHAQLLAMDFPASPDAQAQLNEISEAGRHLSHGLNQLLSQVQQAPADASNASTETLAPTKPGTRTDRKPALPDVPKTLADPDTLQSGQYGHDIASPLPVLVAEDNLANQALLRMQLESLGCRVDVCPDGASALAKWKHGDYALILTDRNMPGMDGLALARSIRAAEREHGGSIPIIAISAQSQPEDVKTCLAAGMNDVLPKPIEFESLREKLAFWRSKAPAHEVTAAQPAREVPSAILDLAYVSRITGSADPVKLRGLIDLFTSTTRNELQAAEQALAQEDARALGQIMHKIKSAARMAGAHRFAHLAEHLESTAMKGELKVLRSCVQELSDILDDVEKAAQYVAEQRAEDAPPAHPASIANLPRKVLVVDDDPLARRQIALVLNAVAIGDIVSVDRGVTALQELAQNINAFDLLITDLNMPGMDGVEFIRRLAEMGYQNGLILCSGVDERLLQTAAELVRAKGMLLRGTVKKPLTRQRLIELLTESEPKKRRPSSGPARIVRIDELQDALEHNQFQIHFQPKVKASTLQVIGVEALARWQRNGEFIPPDTFILAAEQSNLIIPVSESLLGLTLSEGTRLIDAGFTVTIAINISAHWLANIHLPDFIQASCQSSGFPAKHLSLEITETGVMADLSTSLDVLTRLRLKGFNLSIDDFGIGYSSLDQLQRIPFGELKLDRSFVQGAIHNAATRAILASTIEMARKLSITTVAEGVETQAELDLIRGLGCDQAQGWLIAKAMPMDALIDWLHQRQPAQAPPK